MESWSNLTETLPTTSSDLVAYFNKPLEEDAKVPISRYHLSRLSTVGESAVRCSEEELLGIFRISEDEESDYIYTMIKAILLTGAPDSIDSRRSFVPFWDDNIGKIIRLAFTSIKSTRGDPPSTSMDSMTPDFGVLLGGVCTFRGEEMPPKFSGRHPKKKLIDKLTWTYDPAPWILGQYFNMVSRRVMMLIFFVSRLLRCRSPSNSRRYLPQ